MKDIQNQCDRLTAEAVECDMIAKLATDPTKRETFRRLAEQYRSMLESLQYSRLG